MKEKLFFMLLEMSQQTEVFMPVKLRYKMAMLHTATAHIDTWFNNSDIGEKVRNGFEHQESAASLLGLRADPPVVMVAPRIQRVPVPTAVPVTLSTPAAVNNQVAAAPTMPTPAVVQALVPAPVLVGSGASANDPIMSWTMRMSSLRG